MNERSLQINVNSADDARSVIANLPRVKAAYDAASCDSVEFFIAAPVMKAVEVTLRGAIPWCKTFVRLIPLGEGNTWFELPHYAPANGCCCAEQKAVPAAATAARPTAPPTAAIATASGEQVATPRGVAATPVTLAAAVKPTVEPALPAVNVKGFRAEEITPPSKPHGKSAASRPRAPHGA